jgi:hypothetical protein
MWAVRHNRRDRPDWLCAGTARTGAMRDGGASSTASGAVLLAEAPTLFEDGDTADRYSVLEA